jgi:ApaG protein
MFRFAQHDDYGAFLLSRLLNFDSRTLYSDAMYTKTTNDIKVTVLPHYLNEHSEPAENRYVWAYTIQVENHGKETVKLTHRTWHITDGLGRTHEVKGEGVVGSQPVLKPGEAFEYTSGVPLETPSGIMVGKYDMVRGDADKIQVAVPAFSLDSPFGMKRPN